MQNMLLFYTENKHQYQIFCHSLLYWLVINIKTKGETTAVVVLSLNHELSPWTHRWCTTLHACWKFQQNL